MKPDLYKLNTRYILQIMAPGEKIPCTGFLDLVIQTDGTSLSAAHVAGAASLLWSMNPDKPASFIRSLLNESARSKGLPQEYGNGVLDVAYAVDHISDGALSVENETIVLPQG